MEVTFPIVPLPLVAVPEELPEPEEPDEPEELLHKSTQADPFQRFPTVRSTQAEPFHRLRVKISENPDPVYRLMLI